MRSLAPRKPRLVEVIVGARLIGGDLAAEQNGEAWVAFDDCLQLTPRKSIGAHDRQATGRSDTLERPL
jgi:hypothetical protein